MGFSESANYESAPMSTPNRMPIEHDEAEKVGNDKMFDMLSPKVYEIVRERCQTPVVFFNGQQNESVPLADLIKVIVSRSQSLSDVRPENPAQQRIINIITSPKNSVEQHVAGNLVTLMNVTLHRALEDVLIPNPIPGDKTSVSLSDVYPKGPNCNAISSETIMGLALAGQALGLTDVKFGWKQSPEIYNPTRKEYGRVRRMTGKIMGKTFTMNPGGIPQELPSSPVSKSSEISTSSIDNEVKTTSSVSTPNSPKTIIEKKEKLPSVSARREHESAKTAVCKLKDKITDGQIASLQEQLKVGKRPKFTISAGVDCQPVRQRSRERVEQEAGDSIDRVVKEKCILSQTKADTLTKRCFGHPGLKNTSQAMQYNKYLLMSRSTAIVEDLYDSVIAPYVATLPSAQQSQARSELVSNIIIGDLTVGDKTSKNLQADRYTNFAVT